MPEPDDTLAPAADPDLPVPEEAPALDVGALIASAALPETTVPVCLRGDLAVQVEDLDRDLVEQRRAGETSLAGAGGLRRLAEQIEDLREQMRASTVTFRLRALSRPEWTALLADHPPRKGDPIDQELGFDREVFYASLIQASTVEPALDAGQWTHLLTVALSNGQFDELATAAWNLSRKRVSVPFSPAASAQLRRSDETQS